MFGFMMKKRPKVWAVRVVRKEAVEALGLGAYAIQHYDPSYVGDWHDYQGRYHTEQEAYRVAMLLAKHRDQCSVKGVPLDERTF